MIKIFKYFIVILLINAFLFNSFVEANLIYNKKIRSKIINDFKQEQYNNIFFGENILLNKEEDLNFFETQNKIGIYENIKNKNKEKKEELIIQKNALSNRVMNLKETIASIEADLENIAKEISDLNRNIVNTNLNIKTLKEDIDLLQKEILENRAILLDYIAHIYKKSNLVFKDSEVDTIKTILLNNSNLSDILNDIHFLSLLEITGQLLIEKHRKLIKDMFIKKMELEKDIKNLKELRKQELIKRKIQIQKKDFKQKILDYTKGKEELFTEFINLKKDIDRNLKIKIIQNKIKLRDQKKELLKKYNCDYIDENTLNKIGNEEIYFQEFNVEDNNCFSLNKILIAESKLKQNEEMKKNPLLWPVNPINGLSAYYKDKSYEEIVGATHDGIDIKTPQGTDIIAPADGYITFLKEPTDESYAYVALKHANGFITVYGHVSEVLFKKYDFIKAGEVFARSGGEIGTLGAGYITTGPHLHFEVFKDKEYKDPLEYLDLTELGDKNIPPEQKYFYKFLSDYEYKYGLEYEGDLKDNINIFTLSGSTEIERQKDLLAKYATPDFNKWDMWVEEAVEGGIDPSFVMCIGLAETGLGRNLKTPFNVGNVGNTDSGGTLSFENARSGIYWIVRTLNNKFLGEYNDMSKLSRYGNKNGKIYASSSINWHRNMIRCLSALKNKHIPDDYNFRVLY